MKYIWCSVFRSCISQLICLHQMETWDTFSSRIISLLLILTCLLLFTERRIDRSVAWNWLRVKTSQVKLCSRHLVLVSQTSIQKDMSVNGKSVSVFVFCVNFCSSQSVIGAVYTWHCHWFIVIHVQLSVSRGAGSKLKVEEHEKNFLLCPFTFLQCPCSWVGTKMRSHTGSSLQHISRPFRRQR